MWQIENLKLIEANALIVVPRIRTSDYLQLLSDNLTTLPGAEPGNIQDPRLPSLRHLIVVNNSSTIDYDRPRTLDLKAALDFGDLFIYDDPSANAMLSRRTRELDQHDVMNLQFTRSETRYPRHPARHIDGR